MSKRIVRTSLLAVLALAAAAAPASADWLVLTDGGRVETAGPWEVRGGLVVFTLANGTLSSVRASEVDLPASAAATEAAKRPPEPAAAAAPPPKPKARVVLTEKDLPPVYRPPAPAETAEGEEAASEGAAAPAAGAPAGGDPRLAVADWNAATPDDYDGTVVTGRLRNVSEQLLTRAAVDVVVYNASGTLLSRASATFLDPGPIAPDRVADFEARFAGVYGVTAARFDVRGVGFLENEPAPAPSP